MAQTTRPRAPEGRLISEEEWTADQEYVREHSHHTRIADWETELFDEGSGDPILYVPIVGHVEVVYAKQLRDFSRDYRAITYRRPDQVTQPVMIERRVIEVREVLDHLGIERAHIVGRGEAGVAASNFAYTFPDRTRSLVLVSIGMRRDIPPVQLTRLVSRLVLHLPLEGWLVTPDRVRNQVVSYLSGSEQRLTYDQLMSVYRQIPNFDKVYKYAVTPLEIYHNLEGKAQKITAPTLLVTSDEDQRATETDLRELAAALPDCRGVHVIHQGGHFANYIQGEEFNRLVRSFYDQIAAGSATGSGVSSERGEA
jgi:pimeloyl-ACP methyl ester carboxylesterase